MTDTDPTMTGIATSPGYKTFTFWGAALATVLTALGASGAHFMASGVFASVYALLASAVGAAGYATWRAFAKSEDPAKPAYKTTEFWLSLASVIVGGLVASGAFASGGLADKAIAGAAALLAALGYGVSKSAAKPA